MNETVCFEFWWKICVEKLGGQIRWKRGWKNWVGKFCVIFFGKIRLKIGWKNWVGKLGGKLVGKLGGQIRLKN